MSKLLRRPTRAACFYCQSPVSPGDPRSFHCPSCLCWNRYDANNDIVSDEPAMHDEKLNAPSFARRASPRKDRFPATFANTVFCHTCQTNQTLASNILSNYLPPPDHPEYSAKLQALDAYRESVELRYPSVCANCLPAVEEEIERRDNMARVTALGGFLRDSKGKGKQRAGEASHVQKDRLEKSLSWWRVRGALWVATLAATLFVYLSTALDSDFMRISKILGPPSLLWTIFSIFWTAWDPTYATKKRDELQGRPVRQVGKQKYNIMQTFIWSSRLLTSVLFTLPRYLRFRDYLNLSVPSSSIARIYCSAMLFVECSLLILSLVVLQIRRTPTLHLVETSSRRPSIPPSHVSSRAGTPNLDSGCFTALTVSHQAAPLSPSPLSNPIFGLPSLAARSSNLENLGNSDVSAHTMDDEDGDRRERDPNAMDWSPTVSPIKPDRQARSQRNDKGFLLRPQKFYAPEEPTGLENLFEQTIKLADSGDETYITRTDTGFNRRLSQSRVSVPTLIAKVTAVVGILVAVGVGAGRNFNQLL